MPEFVEVSVGMAAVLDRKSVCCGGGAAVESEEFDLYVPVRIVGFPPNPADVVTALHALPQASRWAFWERFRSDLSVYNFVSQVEAMGLASQIDDRIGFTIYQGSAFAVVGNLNTTVDYRSLVQFSRGFMARSVMMCMPAVFDPAPDGFCYLQSTTGAPKAVLAAVFGPYPEFGRMARYMRSDTRVVVVGEVAHVVAKGGELLAEVGYPSLRLGGSVCWNQDRVKGIGECADCQQFYQPTCPVGVVEALGDAAASLRHLQSVYAAPDQHDMDILGLVEPARQISRPDPRMVGARDRLGLLTVGANVTLPHTYWAVWLDKGEAFKSGSFEFRPVTFGGGLIVGYGSMSFEYDGPHELLVWREFSAAAWRKFQHTVMRLGVGSSFQERAGRIPGGGNTWMLVPGSGMRTRSKHWGVGVHPADGLPGRRGYSSWSKLEAYCRLFGETSRSLDVGSYVTALDYTGKVSLGGALKFGRGGGILVWCGRSSAIDLCLGPDAEVVVHSRVYAERRVAANWVSYTTVVRNREDNRLAGSRPNTGDLPSDVARAQRPSLVSRWWGQ